MTTIRVRIAQTHLTAVGRIASLRRVVALLPENYTFAGHAHLVHHADGSVTVIVKGTDIAGWTAADYVVPRLASGGYAAEIEEVLS